MFESPFQEGIVGQAFKSKKLEFQTWDLRKYTHDVHKSIDDRPFGGGDGMVMLPEIIQKAFDEIKEKNKSARRRVIYLSPQGQKLTQSKVKDLAENYDNIVLLCGRYGGVDERLLEQK